jgi:hypothetical protein
MYVDDDLFWARQRAADALTLLLRVVPVSQLQWFTTSMLKEWRPVTTGGIAQIGQALTLAWNQTRPRRLFWFASPTRSIAPAWE